tara:strand:- start:319 stop:1176 length:858 start_codon:yes stop_codon:yes gene_type:complete
MNLLKPKKEWLFAVHGSLYEDFNTSNNKIHKMRLRYRLYDSYMFTDRPYHETHRISLNLLISSVQKMIKKEKNPPNATLVLSENDLSNFKTCIIEIIDIKNLGHKIKSNIYFDITFKILANKNINLDFKKNKTNVYLTIDNFGMEEGNFACRNADDADEYYFVSTTEPCREHCINCRYHDCNNKLKTYNRDTGNYSKAKIFCPKPEPEPKPKPKPKSEPENDCKSCHYDQSGNNCICINKDTKCTNDNWTRYNLCESDNYLYENSDRYAYKLPKPNTDDKDPNGT